MSIRDIFFTAVVLVVFFATLSVVLSIQGSEQIFGGLYIHKNGEYLLKETLDRCTPQGCFVNCTNVFGDRWEGFASEGFGGCESRVKKTGAE